MLSRFVEYGVQKKFSYLDFVECGFFLCLVAYQFHFVKVSKLNGCWRIIPQFLLTKLPKYCLGADNGGTFIARDNKES